MCISHIRPVVAVCIVVFVILVFCRCYGGGVVEGNSDGTNAKCNYDVNAIIRDINVADSGLKEVLEQLKSKMSDNSSQLESNYAIDYAKASQVLAVKIERCAHAWARLIKNDDTIKKFKVSAYDILKNAKGVSSSDGATYMACKEIELITCANTYFAGSLNILLNTTNEVFYNIKDSFDCLNGV